MLTCTMPDGTPAENISQLRETEAGVNVGFVGAIARRVTSSSRQRERTVSRKAL